MEYTFRLTGRVKPYVRMTQKGKFVSKEALQYLASKDALAFWMRTKMLARGWEMIPRGVKLSVGIVIQPVRHNCDLDNQVKAVLDAAQKVVFEDDRWVDVITACRHGDGEDVTHLNVQLVPEELEKKKAAEAA